MKKIELTNRELSLLRNLIALYLDEVMPNAEGRGYPVDYRLPVKGKTMLAGDKHKFNILPPIARSQIIALVRRTFKCRIGDAKKVLTYIFVM